MNTSVRPIKGKTIGANMEVHCIAPGTISKNLLKNFDVPIGYPSTLSLGATL